MNRKDIIHIGVRAHPDGGPAHAAKDPARHWYLSISELTRREMRLPYHKRLRVRLSQHGSPVILPVVPTWRTAVHTEDTLLPVRVSKNKQGIVLGPIIGILTVKRPGATTFRGNRANFRDIAKMGKRLGLTVAVFTPEGLAKGGDSVLGYIHAGPRKGATGTKWRQVVLPLPSVVYNRVPDRESEARADVVRAKKWLAERGIPLFNNGFFNKADLYRWLQDDQETAPYLPRTAPLESHDQLRRWVREHELLYVKPADGKAGDGIIQVRREGERFRVTYQHNGKRSHTTHKNRQDAADAIWSRTRGRDYLLQQGIYLTSHAGRHFDLRLLLQKNRYGIWQVTGMGARIADADGITTHVPNGGQIEKADKLLRASFGRQKGDEVGNKVKQTALRLAETIERAATRDGGLIGEMSMDIGLASDGKLWFFEANAKPMKFDEPYIRAKSLMRLLHYCEFLTRSN